MSACILLARRWLGTLGANLQVWLDRSKCGLGRDCQKDMVAVGLPLLTFHSLLHVPFGHRGELDAPSALGPHGPGRQQPSLCLPPGHGGAGPRDPQVRGRVESVPLGGTVGLERAEVLKEAHPRAQTCPVRLCPPPQTAG